jgi:hypothetical protein
MSGGDGYMNDLLGSEGCKKMLLKFHYHSFETYTSHHLLSHSQVTNPLMSST